MAWQHILPEVSVEGFKKCCISSAVDEIHDGMVWYGSEKDGKVWSESEEDEGTDCEDWDSNTDW